MIELLSKGISAGMRDAHNQDVRNLKRYIATIYTLVDPPARKGEWGFRYGCTASLLRPVDVAVGSAQWYLIHLRPS